MVFRDDGSLERGQVHIGRFVDGVCHGYGKRFDRNGRIVFDGEWVKGEMLVGNTYFKAENRRGRFMRDRDLRRRNRVDMKGSYSGEIAPWANKNDIVPHGHGVCHYDDGLTYDGYWDRGVLLDTPPLSGVTVTSSKQAKEVLLGALKGGPTAAAHSDEGSGGGGTRPKATASPVSTSLELPADSSTRREVQLGAFKCETCEGKFRVKFVVFLLKAIFFNCSIMIKLLCFSSSSYFQRCTGQYGTRRGTREGFAGTEGAPLDFDSKNTVWRGGSSLGLDKIPESPNTRWCCLACEESGGSVDDEECIVEGTSVELTMLTGASAGSVSNSLSAARSVSRFCGTYVQVFGVLVHGAPLFARVVPSEDQFYIGETYQYMYRLSAGTQWRVTHRMGGGSESPADVTTSPCTIRCADVGGYPAMPCEVHRSASTGRNQQEWGPFPNEWGTLNIRLSQQKPVECSFAVYGGSSQQAAPNARGGGGDDGSDQSERRPTVASASGPAATVLPRSSSSSSYVSNIPSVTVASNVGLVSTSTNLMGTFIGKLGLPDSLLGRENGDCRVAVNDEGYLTEPGSAAAAAAAGGRSDFYCGRFFGLQVFPPTGVCGPTSGPQCGSCTRWKRTPLFLPRPGEGTSTTSLLVPRIDRGADGGAGRGGNDGGGGEGRSGGDGGGSSGNDRVEQSACDVGGDGAGKDLDGKAGTWTCQRCTFAGNMEDQASFKKAICEVCENPRTS